MFYFDRFTISKHDLFPLFRITLDIELCIDGQCEATLVFENLHVPIPLCNTDYSNFVLPGDGTVAGFVQEFAGNIGEAGVNLVIQKLGIAVSVMCDQNTYKE